MKTLILQRHAKAEKDGDDDLCRSLTPVGLSDADFQGETLRQQEIYPELILHSHAMRARQTAEIMAVKLELSQGYTVEDAELYNCDSSDLIAIIRNLPPVLRDMPPKGYGLTPLWTSADGILRRTCGAED